MRSRVCLMRAECEVVEYNPRTYFLISGYNRPIGVPYVVQELVEEKNMLHVDEMHASAYLNPLSPIIMCSIRDEVRKKNPASYDLNRLDDLYYGIIEDLMLQPRKELGWQTKKNLDMYLNGIGNTMLVIDLANYFDLFELNRVLQLFAEHPRMHMIFYNISKHSELYHCIKERGY